MDPNKRNRTAQNRQDARAALLASRTAEQQNSGNDLNDAKIQDTIMNPPGVVVEIGKEEVRLYPVSGATARQLVGVANQVFASASAGAGNPALRISGVLVELYLDKFLPILAESTFEKPSDITLEEKQRLVRHFDNITASVEGAFQLAGAFNEILTINGVMDFFGQRSKKEATQKQG